MSASEDSTSQSPEGYSPKNGDNKPENIGELLSLFYPQSSDASSTSFPYGSKEDFLDCSNSDAKKSTDDDYCDPNCTDKKRGLTGRAREVACSIREEELVLTSQKSNTDEPFFCSLQRLGVQPENYDYTCYGLFFSSCLIKNYSIASDSDSRSASSKKKSSAVNSPCACRTKYALKGKGTDDTNTFVASLDTSSNESNCNILYQCICNPNKIFELFDEASTQQADEFVNTLRDNNNKFMSAYRIECHSILPRESGDLAYCYLKTEAFPFEGRLDCSHPIPQKNIDLHPHSISDSTALSEQNMQLLEDMCSGFLGSSNATTLGTIPLGAALQNVQTSGGLLGLLLLLICSILKGRAN